MDENLAFFDNSDTERISMMELALSLASDFSSVYYVNMKTHYYHEYAIVDGGSDMKVLSSGNDFFADAVINCRKIVYKDDQELFLSKINKESLEHVLTTGESFTLNYRLMINNVPTHFQLKTIKSGTPGDVHLLVAVKNVDAEVREQEKTDKETKIYNHIATALASRYEAIYYVDIITDVYSEYSINNAYADLDIPSDGSDFFTDTAINMERDIHPEDLPMMKSVMEKDQFLTLLERDSIISLTYRLMVKGEPQYMNLRAIMPENDKRHVIIAVSNIDMSVKRETEFKAAVALANKDALTGVKNKYAYLTLCDEINAQINDDPKPAFAVVVCDINNLKKVNDFYGHIEGDNLIKNACHIICCIYKHSPVFRIGGDEFVVVLRGSDYEQRHELLETIRATISENKKNGDVVIATGLSVFDPAKDTTVNDVFQRADDLMYTNKSELKEK